MSARLFEIFRVLLLMSAIVVVGLDFAAPVTSGVVSKRVPGYTVNSGGCGVWESMGGDLVQPADCRAVDSIQVPYIVEIKRFGALGARVARCEVDIETYYATQIGDRFTCREADS